MATIQESLAIKRAGVKTSPLRGDKDPTIREF